MSKDSSDDSKDQRKTSMRAEGRVFNSIFNRRTRNKTQTWRMDDLESIKKFKHEFLKRLRLLLTALELCSTQVIIDFLHFLIVVMLNFFISWLWRRDFLLHWNISWLSSWNSFHLLSSLDLDQIVIQLIHNLIKFIDLCFRFFDWSWNILLLIIELRRTKVILLFNYCISSWRLII